jgi:hypothetical protein
VELLLEYELAWGLGTAAPEKPNVEFGDSVSDGPETVARVIQLLDAATAISLETKIRMRSPELDDAQVMEEIARIREDQRSSILVEEEMAGHAGNQPGAGGGPGDEDEGDEPKE